jgi:arginine-tRNA-protein transferase
VLDTDPPELLVYDEPTRCPYLPEQTARLPMRLPSRPLDRTQFAQRLETGDRRQGLVLYRPNCPDCKACEPIRILVDEFQPNKTQRRVWRRGHEKFDVHLATPAPSPDKVDLYNRHKRGRALLGDGEEISAGGYDAFLVDSCTESFELRYLHKGDLMGVAVVDRADDALSAVYTYFDPDFGRSSPGVFSILTQLELCRRWGLRYLYLGLYVEDCKAMTYKSSYLPHERRIGDNWERFEPVGPTSPPTP